MDSSEPSVTCPTNHIGELSLTDKALGLGAHKLLLQLDELGALGLLVLELGNLICELGLVVDAGLDAGLGITDGLEQQAVFFELLHVVGVLLANLGVQDTSLVADVGDGIVASCLSPFGNLAGDCDALFGGGLVRIDHVVLRLDDLEHPLARLGLDIGPERADGEAMLGWLGSLATPAELRPEGLPVGEACSQRRARMSPEWMYGCLTSRLLLMSDTDKDGFDGKGSVCGFYHTIIERELHR